MNERHFPSDSEERVAALQTIEALKGLTLEEYRRIADAGSERSAADGELIFTQGAPAAPPHLRISRRGSHQAA